MIEETEELNNTINEILPNAAEEVIGKSSGERKGKNCTMVDREMQ